MSAAVSSSTADWLPETGENEALTAPDVGWKDCRFRSVFASEISGSQSERMQEMERERIHPVDQILYVATAVRHLSRLTQAEIVCVISGKRSHWSKHFSPTGQK